MKNRFFRGQFAIADLLLALTVVAAWTAFAVSESRIERLSDEIHMLQEVAGELTIADATQYHAIAQTVIRYPDEAWQIHLPQGHSYQLHAVTRGIQANGFPETEHIASIEPGLHRIELRHVREIDKFRFIVAVDEESRLDLHETSDWNKSNGSSSTGIGKTQQVLPLDQPLVLKRLRVNTMNGNGSSSSPPGTEAVNGLLIWITAQSPSD